MTQLSNPPSALGDRYDKAAPRWRDKMRALGYFDAYLGFLADPVLRPEGRGHVIDMGAGTGAFAEAWVAVHGAPDRLTLVDPSSRMLERGQAALARYGVAAKVVPGRLGDVFPAADEVLAAHLIEHFEDPLDALQSLAALLRPGGVLRLVVSKPHWCNAIIWLQWRHRSYGPERTRRLIEAAGLTVVSDYAFPAGPPSRTSRAYVARRAV